MAAKPSFELRLRVLHAVFDAPGEQMRERIKHVADKPFTDVVSGHTCRFTWRTISTWLYRHKKTASPRCRTRRARIRTRIARCR